MIYVGIDDTDTLETPGTNKLAMHLAELLSPRFETKWIVRHQLLEDPRVPCTNKNGCASILLDPRDDFDREELILQLTETIVSWCPPGSDPGLCFTELVPAEIVAWGRSAQSQLLHQSDAIALADRLGVYLKPLGGSGDGVIGALAAVGLLASWNSGRVVYRGRHGRDAFDVSGCHDIDALFDRGIDQVLTLESQQTVTHGMVDVGKRLRPNLRNGRVVLYVEPAAPNGPAAWEAKRVVA